MPADSAPPRELTEALAAVDAKIKTLAQDFKAMGFGPSEAHRRASIVHQAERRWLTDAIGRWQERQGRKARG